MDILGLLIPAALFLGLVGLGAFIWALRSNQFEDLDGAAMRILIDDDARGAAPEAGDGEKEDRPAARP